MSQSLSYSITSLASDEVNQTFHTAKAHFDLLYTQPKTKPEHFILKNLAHVTLKRLFYLKEGIRDEEMQSALSSIIFSPITIESDSLDLFRTEKWGNVLVALVKKSPELQKLHDELSELVDNCAAEQDTNFEKHTFNPHLTILYHLPEGRIPEARKYAEEKIIPLKYTLNSIRFMREVPGVKGEREMLKEYVANG